MKILIFFLVIWSTLELFGGKKNDKDFMDTHTHTNIWDHSPKEKEDKRKRCQDFAEVIHVDSVVLLKLPDFVRVVKFESVFVAGFDWSDQNLST